MITLVIDTNIIFSSIYKKNGLERTIINAILENNSIQLFAPDVYKEEISRNLGKKLGYDQEIIDLLLTDFDVIEVPFDKYRSEIPRAKKLMSHKNDIPYIAVALLINSPVWSGNAKHFNHLENSEEVIWFNSRGLYIYLKEKGISLDKFKEY